METAGFIIVLLLTMLAVASPLYIMCFKMLKNVRVRIETKIDEALVLQSGRLQDEINLLKKDVNELKKEIKILRQLAALINRTPLPDHMTEGD